MYNGALQDELNRASDGTLCGCLPKELFSEFQATQESKTLHPAYIYFQHNPDSSAAN